MVRRIISVGIALCSAGVSPAFAGGSYIRSTEGEGGSARLETAARVFEDARGRRVALVGATHVGDPGYYDELEDLLNGYELVLYEGVGPAWRDIGHDASDAVRVRYTRARMHDAGAQLAADYRHGVRSKTRDEWLGTHAPFRRRAFETALTDGWGNPVAVAIDTGAKRYTLLSLGADGRAGGDGHDADIERSGSLVLANEPNPDDDAIQRRLAEAAGLAFQLEEVDYTPRSWQNSDATIAELWNVEAESLLSDEPGDGEGGSDPLFSLLSGESGLAKVMGSVLGFIGRSERSSFLFRVMLVEMLGNADEAMLAAGLGEEMAEMLLTRRNEIVMRDLADTLGSDDAPASIAVFYGAAHLPDLQERLEARGFKPVSTTWHPAVTADPATVGIAPEQAKAFRGFVSSMVQSQMATLRAMQEQQKNEDTSEDD
ncbi:MAG: hypothetical protein DHS20C14_22310 [Phycisphaeraceae bacterium]|nr:MAG: hypothetical protein DHS20C14_22310 [Phycisphaeraceae bacterium]